MNENTLMAFKLSDLASAFEVLDGAVDGGMSDLQRSEIRAAIQREVARRIVGGHANLGR